MMSLGRTGSVPCVVIQPAFYDKTPYGCSEVHAVLHKLNKGKSQCRKVKDRNVRVTYMYQSAFGEQLDSVLEGEKSFIYKSTVNITAGAHPGVVRSNPQK